MVKRDSISKPQLIVSCTLTIVNTICLIIYSFQNTWSRVHLFLTKWSLYLNSLYMIITMIADIKLYLNDKSFEHINDILRNNIGPSLNGISHVVMVAYWILLPLGMIEFSSDNIVLEVIKNTYTHGFISFFLIADVFVIHRDNIDIHLINIIGVIGFTLMYMIILIVECLLNGKPNPYAFMDNMSLGFLLLVGFVIFVGMILGYIAHVGLVKLKYKLKCCVDGNVSEEDVKLVNAK